MTKTIILHYVFSFFLRTCCSSGSESELSDSDLYPEAPRTEQELELPSRDKFCEATYVPAAFVLSRARTER